MTALQKRGDLPQSTQRPQRSYDVLLNFLCALTVLGGEGVLFQTSAYCDCTEETKELTTETRRIRRIEMSVLARLACMQERRDEAPNKSLARDLAEKRDIEGIREIAENLWNKDKNIQTWSWILHLYPGDVSRAAPARLGNCRSSGVLRSQSEIRVCGHHNSP